MRILIANEALVGSGGVETYLAALIPALVARGHHVALLHANTRNEQGGTRLDGSAEVTASVADEGLERAIERVRAWRPQVCFSHNMRPLDVETRLLAEWPVVKMMHGYFGTCIGGQKAHAFPSMAACSRAFGPACLAMYLPRHCGQYRPLVMLEEFKWAMRQRALLPQYAGVVAASGHMADEYARAGVERARLLTAPLFPTASTSEPLRELPAVPTVMFAARMTPIKGGTVLVRAIARASEFLGQRIRLTMAGVGPERDTLQRLAVSLNVDATFAGWADEAARTTLIRQSSLVAVPSLWPEPFGLTGLEAGVHGVPAVAFDVGGIREWLRDDVNGVLVAERGSAEAMGRAIASLLGNRSELARLGDGAARVARELSLDEHVQKIERILAAAAGPARAAV